MPKQIDYREIAKSLETKASLPLDESENEIMNQIWNADHSLDYDANLAFKNLELKINQKQSIPLKVWWSVAAVAFIAITLGIYSYFSPTTYSTRSGEIAEITLPDNSIVTLKGGSKLTLEARFGQHARLLSLNGLAEFKVKKNPSKPFVVESSKGKIKVLGTTFQIMDYEQTDIFNLGVTEGRVELTSNEDKIVMTAGQSAQILGNKIVLNNKLESPNKLVFKDIAIQDLVHILEKRFGTQIVYDKSISQTKLTLSIEESLNLTNILEILTETTDQPFTTK
jgi:ferric-dicitrate binding protein FerR (iron transport regulator)